MISPTECFLRYATLPEDDIELLDVQQVAVTILSYLDRFSISYSPVQKFGKVSYHKASERYWQV